MAIETVKCKNCGRPIGADMKFCPYCAPALRQSEIDAVNQAYAPGGDHDENLTELRRNYYDYLLK